MRSMRGQRRDFGRIGTTEVAPCGANEVALCANDVALRANDVALHANDVAPCGANDIPPSAVKTAFGGMIYRFAV